ncbi:hypothetical protein A2872_02800 [Candidatus Gottesmanbacteria bacterium RIFCSPHIGHO2_01_FULL_42_12]|uniref:Glycosyltransferase RgtA/B/C/D-like domain-containing protein n=1 Tax=Candidatus Gottesmanbacteria bacterium RIFCSPHIGHO2_01_FULL_42_12 TaxID=1798377 RepID=A0A1F5Z3V1_9BACT|nr:MAG: hypothetical protein A2872_02800 [Candidatus Gottesmanbacteria bacterium RIFCSPHIGHO2_01_FULL_42_12]
MRKYLPFVISLLTVIYLGMQKRWLDILIGDLRGTYFAVSSYFWSNGNLTDFVGVSAYPPGANLFFMMLPAVSLEFNQWSLIIINCLFLFFIARLTKRPTLLALIILAAGPIILFRFDLLVMFLVVLSLITFRRNKFYLSGILLGAATITKIFPVILLPYFIFVLFVNNRQKILPWLSAFILSQVAIFVFFVLVTNQDPRAISSQTTGGLSTSVHVESVMATVLTLITAITNPGPHGLEFLNARWNISPLYFLGHARIFKLISPVFVALVYALILFRYKTFKIADGLLIILTLLITSQLLSPQYIIWPAILVLLMDKIDRITIFLLVCALVSTQIIYPLNYGEFLDFYNKGINSHLFLIMAVRNLSLVILTLRLGLANFSFDANSPRVINPVK